MSYKIKYPYYHYNTGRADNGYYMGYTFANTFAEAMQIADSIDYAFSKRLQQEHDSNVEIPECVRDTEDIYLNGDGYFTGKAQVFEVTETFIR